MPKTITTQNTRLVIFLGGLVVMLAIGSLASIFTGIYAERMEKENLLEKTVTIATLISKETLQELSGTPEDLQNPAFQELKSTLTHLGNIDNNIRYIYIMSKTPERIFFYIDTQPDRFQDFPEPLAMPGETYTDVTPGVEAVFDEKKSLVVGPETDKWGTFISALTPITNLKGKNLLVGMDISNKTWNQNILTKQAVPALITLILMGIWTGFFIYKSMENKDLSLMNDLKKFKQVVDSAYDHIVVTDPEGTILYANQGASKITGYSNKEILGTKAGKLWGMQMPKEFYQNMWDTIKIKKIPFIGDIQNKRKNGEIYDARVTISPVLDHTNKILYFIGIERDTTKEKNIDRMKSEFIGLASHQLRTPLTAIKWFIELLLEGDLGTLTPEQEKCLQNMTNANERLTEMVEALLNVSKIESGTIPINKTSVDIKKLNQSIKESLVGLIEARKIDLDTKLPEDLKSINADELLLRQALINVLENAIKYSPEGTRVELTETVQDNFLLIKIADQGYGIPEQDKENLFKKFKRGSNILKFNTDGNGLGLYLAKTIIDNSGGSIWFDSQEGKGTTMWIKHPVN